MAETQDFSEKFSPDENIFINEADGFVEFFFSFYLLFLVPIEAMINF